MYKIGEELKDYERNTCSTITYFLLITLTISQQSIKFTEAEETRFRTTFSFHKKSTYFKSQILTLKYT